MKRYSIIISTTATEREAQVIANTLLEKELVACVNIVPGVQSFYRWEGKVERSTEWLLLIKTEARLFAQVSETIRTLSSYICPECIAIAVEKGSKPYLEWLSKSLGSSSGSRVI